MLICNGKIGNTGYGLPCECAHYCYTYLTSFRQRQVADTKTKTDGPVWNALQGFWKWIKEAIRCWSTIDCISQMHFTKYALIFDDITLTTPLSVIVDSWLTNQRRFETLQCAECRSRSTHNHPSKWQATMYPLTQHYHAHEIIAVAKFSSHRERAQHFCALTSFMFFFQSADIYVVYKQHMNAWLYCLNACVCRCVREMCVNELYVYACTTHTTYT